MVDIRISLKEHATDLASKIGDSLAWRNRLSPAQARYVAFAEDLVYGTRRDQQWKALRKAGKTAVAINNFPGLIDAKNP